MDEYGLPDAFLNVPYAPGTAGGYTLTALNAAGPVTWSFQQYNPGSLPPGMTLSPSGLISGTPTQAGVFNFSLQFTDGVSTAYRGGQINVSAIMFTNSLQLLNATQYSAYSTSVTASGGTGALTFTTPGGLPNGLTLSLSGGISGTINAGPGRYGFSVTATDINQVSYTHAMSIDVVGTPPQLPEIQLNNLQYNTATIGVNYSRLISVVAGGTAPFTWSAIGLPAGMALRTYQTSGRDDMSPDDAELWGTPTQSGTFPVTVTVRDFNGVTATQIFSFQVSVMMVDYGSDGLPNGTIGVFYSKTLRALGGKMPYTVSQIDTFYNPLPDGLSLNTGTFVVSGTPSSKEILTRSSS